METLILHELLEVALHEMTELPPMACHIVATAFERQLRGLELAMVIEAYYLDNLIILDINMAELGGLDTLKALRADPDIADTPVIMLTVEARNHVIREAMSYQVTDYLIKPAKSKELKERIGKVMQDG